MHDTIIPKGTITFQLIKGNGKVEETTVENLVVQDGRDWITARLSDTNRPNVMSHIAVGEGTTEPILADIALESEIATGGRATMDPVGGEVTDNVIAYTASFAAGEGTGAITEAGIFNNDDTMLSRAEFPVINKQQDDTLNIIWRVRIQ